MHQRFMIVGLGNPGESYAPTRHNIGFAVVNALATCYDNSFVQKKYAYTASFRHKGHTLNLLKPTTYMNMSGRAVDHYMKKGKIDLACLLVILDDVSLPFGRLRLRSGGSSGGHNGLKSIEEWLQTQAYARLRFGIGHDFPRGGQSHYVLSAFDQAQIHALPQPMDKAIKTILCFCEEGIQKAMNSCHANTDTHV